MRYICVKYLTLIMARNNGRACAERTFTLGRNVRQVLQTPRKNVCACAEFEL